MYMWDLSEIVALTVYIYRTLSSYLHSHWRSTHRRNVWERILEYFMSVEVFFMFLIEKKYTHHSSVQLGTTTRCYYGCYHDPVMLLSPSACGTINTMKSMYVSRHKQSVKGLECYIYYSINFASQICFRAF